VSWSTRNWAAISLLHICSIEERTGWSSSLAVPTYDSFADAWQASRAVAEAGASLGVVEAPNLAIDTGRDIGRHVLLSQSVDGVVCPSDLLAVGVIQAATDLGIRVPDELMVVGYDDNHFASESSIPVSTVSLSGYRMGELAIELLLEEIHEGSGHVHRTVMLDPHLIPRRSSLR
jgi:LacI family transcriptional regulator